MPSWFEGPLSLLFSLSRAAWSSVAGKARGASRTNKTIMMAPPTNSAAANCHPISSHRIAPSSSTRFVLANMNTIALVKSAPRWKSDFASALAAYEQELLAAPSRLVRTIVRGRWSPITRSISARDTNDWMAPATVNPATSAHSVSQNMKKPSRRLSPSVPSTPIMIRSRSDQPGDRVRGLLELRVLLFSACPDGGHQAVRQVLVQQA